MKNILVIDDDLHIGNVLEETLTNEGYGVIRAFHHIYLHSVSLSQKTSVIT